MIGITNAPLEHGHSWRQALTNMIARNFYETGPDVFHPKIDMAGEKSGIIGSEFPFFNFLIYLLAKIFGYTHWYGRLINLIACSFGSWYFFRLTRELFNSKVAFNATIILHTSLWFEHGRKIMPDVFSVSLVIIGLYHAYDYLKSNKSTSLILYLSFSGLGVLCKIPALTLLAGTAVVPFLKSIPNNRKISFLITSFLIILITSLWYFYWVPHLVQTYLFELYFPKSMREGVQEILPLLPNLFEKFYFIALESFVAFGFCVIGVYAFVKNENRLYVFSLALITIVFCIFIIKSGSVFPTHSYYIVPFVPVMALLAGYGLNIIPAKYRIWILLVIAAEGIGNQFYDLRQNESQLYKLSLEQLTEKYIPKNEKIIINGGETPQNIYFSNQKGWTLENDFLFDSNYIDSLVQLGARYLIIDRHKLPEYVSNHNTLFQNQDYSILQLTK